jgi:hypothetical protein
LVSDGVLERSLLFPLDVFGFSSDRAKIFFWRHERLPLPLAYLQDSGLLEQLRQGLNLAEKVGEAFNVSMRTVARLILVPSRPEEGGENLNQNTKEQIRSLVRSLGADRAYWSRLERPFTQFLVDLAAESIRPDFDQQGIPVATRRWASDLGRAVRQAFTEATRGLDTSARTLGALAKAEPSLYRRLHEVLKDYLNIEQGGEDDETK